MAGKRQGSHGFLDNAALPLACKRPCRSQSSQFCWPRRAASAPAWCGPSILSSGRSALYGAPVYVRHEIVHNKFVVDDLKSKGAIFVDELDEIPAGDRPVIFSAHGVPKAVPAAASARKLFQIDATCPLVTKVHMEAQRHHAEGLEIILIGHKDHPEVIGTMGQLPAGAITPHRNGGRCGSAGGERSGEAGLCDPDDAFGR